MTRESTLRRQSLEPSGDQTHPLRILFVTPWLPSPPRFGAQRRVDGLMRGLSRSHEVSVLSLAEPGEEITCAIEAAEAYCSRVMVAARDVFGLSTRQRRFLQARSLLSPHSFEHLLCKSTALRRLLESLVADGSYDVVNFEFAQMAANWPSIGAGRRARPLFVLDEHNIEHDLVRRTAARAGSVDRKLYKGVDWLKLRREERAAWSRFDGCITTSARDDELLRADAPTTRTAVVPNAVDVHFFQPWLDDAEEEPMRILFFGAVSYHPNADALLHFIRNILPLLQKRYPRIQLQIVGPSVPPEIARRSDETIEVVGPVDDIRPYIARATAVVVPLRIGGGTRFKILEAMAMGKAVVSTTIGAEGIDARDGSEILLADEPSVFAEQVGRLIEDVALRRRIGTAARALIERAYTWDHAIAVLERFYARLFTVVGPRV
jgi:glycosyltransferase involved in cell wall biosynthesis